jgi:hypothetical protein
VSNTIVTWGPALLICLTVVIGILFNNSRINDLRGYVDARFNAVDHRFDDLKDFIRSEVRRLEDRQSPIHRG